MNIMGGALDDRFALSAQAGTERNVSFNVTLLSAVCVKKVPSLFAGHSPQ